MTVFLIAGPTVSGKSSLAHRLAQQIGGEIINADSMQIYQGLPILSAQPTAIACENVPHHLYSYLPPTAQEDVVSWCEKAQACIKNILQRRQKPIIVGGTGLYFKALLEGISPIPAIPKHVREILQKSLTEKGIDEIYAALKELDPETSVDPKNAMRVMRALEVVTHTGQPLSVWQKMPQTPFLKPPHKIIYLKPPRPVLHKRIESRTDDMLENGATKEVQMLGDMTPDAGLYKTIGYKEISDYLAQKIAYSEMKELIHIRTRQYAKRQETWFNNQLDADLVLSSTNTQEATESILSIAR